MTQKPLTVLVSAGGTGGHLFPALAVIEKLKEITESPVHIEFMGSDHRIEAEIVPDLGYRLHTVPIRGLQKVASLQTLQLPFTIVRSVLIARKILKALRPDIVLCAGAYISYPAGAAAAQLGIPLFLMESNAIPGKTIRQLSSKAERTFLAFEETTNYFTDAVQQRCMVAGNPVRQGFLPLPPRESSIRKFQLDPEQKTLLVFGGSQGAQTINAAVEKALSSWVASGIQVIWQTGKRYNPDTVAQLPGVCILPFITDMPAAYAAADLIVCRAGATTIAELAAAGKAAVLAPLSSAANDHQTRNAKVLEQRKAGLVISDGELQTTLPGAVLDLLNDPHRLQIMETNILEVGRPSAALEIAQSLLDYTRDIAPLSV